MSAFRSARPDVITAHDPHDQAAPSIADDFPALPTETEIYILPDGRIIVADLPVELTALVENIGEQEDSSTRD